MNAYDKLETIYSEVKSVEFIKLVLSFNNQELIAPELKEQATEEMKAISAQLTELQSNPKIAKLIKQVDTSKLNNWQVANFHEIQKEFIKKFAVPAELAAKVADITSRFTLKQPQLRKDNNIDDWKPLMKEMVAVKREEYAYIAKALGLATPYDAAVAHYDENQTSEKLDVMFGGLDALPELIVKAQSKTTVYPKVEVDGVNHLNFGKALGEQLGFNSANGFFHLSEKGSSATGSPFNSIVKAKAKGRSFNAYVESVAHEYGHGMYRQNRPTDYIYQPVGEARSIMTNEAIAFLYQRHIAKGRPFAEYMSTLVDVNADSYYESALEVKAGLLRIPADELTYAAHIKIRFEIERDLINGDLEVEELPNVWNEKYQQYLGINAGDDHSNGCMQDVHWSKGKFGYFPAYTVGAMVSAQLWEAIVEAHPNVDAEIANGDFSSIFSFLKENIWSKGRLLSTNELIKQATGKELSADAFLNHLESRYC